MGSLANYFLFPQSNKAVSTYKKVIALTTDKKSLKESEKLLKFLDETIIKNLPTKKSDLDVDLIYGQLENTKDNQLKINKMFDTIDNLFDNQEEVTIDDDIMLLFLANMKKVQEKIAYIYDYLNLVLEVNEANNQSLKNGKTYAFEELYELLKA